MHITELHVSKHLIRMIDWTDLNALNNIGDSSNWTPKTDYNARVSYVATVQCMDPRKPASTT